MMNYIKINNFITLFSKFKECLALSNKYYERANLERFNKKIVDPMEDAWATLNEDERAMVCKN